MVEWTGVLVNISKNTRMSPFWCRSAFTHERRRMAYRSVMGYAMALESLEAIWPPDCRNRRNFRKRLSDRRTLHLYDLSLSIPCWKERVKGLHRWTKKLYPLCHNYLQHRHIRGTVIRKTSVTARHWEKRGTNLGRDPSHCNVPYSYTHAQQHK